MDSVAEEKESNSKIVLEKFENVKTIKVQNHSIQPKAIEQIQSSITQTTKKSSKPYKEKENFVKSEIFPFINLFMKIISITFVLIFFIKF